MVDIKTKLNAISNLVMNTIFPPKYWIWKQNADQTKHHRLTATS